MEEGMKPATETALVHACLDLLRMRGCFVWRQNSGGVRATYKGKSRFFRFNHATGCSDIIGMMPDGRFLAVECKLPGKLLTTHQAAFLDAVRATGGVALVATCLRDLDGVE